MVGVRNKIDAEELRVPSTTTPYPHIRVKELHRSVLLVLSGLDEGTLPLLGTLNGITKILKKINPSAITISKLLRTTGLELSTSADIKYDVEDIEQYMEVYASWI